MQNSTHQPMTSPNIILDLTKALNGEFHAIHCYEQLASQAPNANIKNRILEIRKEEMRHFHMFSTIYTSLTGMQFQPQLTEPCAANFASGVDASFIDEQQTVDFYHRVARTYNSPVIQQAFLEAAADEQNHAVWFLYFLVSAR